MDAIAVEKLCVTCRTMKHLGEFNRNKSRRDGLCEYCRECGRRHQSKVRAAVKIDPIRLEAKRAAARKWKRTPTGKAARRRNQERQSLTRKKFLAIVEQQNGRCAACDKEVGEKLVVDHCHRSGKVRGVICSRCNMAIGWLGDTHSSAKRLAELLVNYLQRTDDF